MRSYALALGILAPISAVAAPLPAVEASEQYVRICDALNAGSFYIPGTDTCLKVSGYLRAEYHYVGGDIALDPNERFNTVTSRTRANVMFDARTPTDIGLVRTYIEFQAKQGPRDVTEVSAGVAKYDQDFETRAAFVEVTSGIGIFTAGRTGSFFDFYGSDDFGTRVDIDDSTTEQALFAYTFAGPSGLTATLSVENPDSSGRRFDGSDDYEGLKVPDIVGNIRLEQPWGSAQMMGARRDIFDETGRGVGWAAGAGLSLNLPFNNNVLAGQVGYSDGALGYITTDPGGIGDFRGPSGEDTNHAWMVRGGLLMPFEHFSGWVDGSFTRVVRFDDAAAYDFKAVVVGVAWKPNANFSAGPEFGYNNIIADGADSGLEVWGLMWRVQADF